MFCFFSFLPDIIECQFLSKVSNFTRYFSDHVLTVHDWYTVLYVHLLSPSTAQTTDTNVCQKSQSWTEQYIKWKEGFTN
jgi:hypothetical protein